MDGRLDQKMFIIPELDKDLIDFAKSLDARWIGMVPIISKPFCKEWDCHNNTIEYTNWYGGTRIIGYYLLRDINRDGHIAILHSVIQTWENRLIDITPFMDGRTYNMFCILKNQIPDYYRQEISSYKIGDAKMDVDENSFKGLSL